MVLSLLHGGVVRIGILTGGCDAPGFNAVIWAVLERESSAAERLAVLARTSRISAASPAERLSASCSATFKRGGDPTSVDRLLATRFDAEATELALARRFGVMVAARPPAVVAVPLETAVGRTTSCHLTPTPSKARAQSGSSSEVSTCRRQQPAVEFVRSPFWKAAT
jgi:6-phosphofructokinase